MNVEAECHPARSKNTQPGTKCTRAFTPLAAAAEGRWVSTKGLTRLCRGGRARPGPLEQRRRPCRDSLPLKAGRSRRQMMPGAPDAGPARRGPDRLCWGCPEAPHLSAGVFPFPEEARSWQGLSCSQKQFGADAEMIPGATAETALHATSPFIQLCAVTAKLAGATETCPGQDASRTLGAITWRPSTRPRGQRPPAPRATRDQPGLGGRPEQSAGPRSGAAAPPAGPRGTAGT